MDTKSGTLYNQYQDFEECRKALFEYIESWYNRQRIHSVFGYKTPQQILMCCVRRGTELLHLMHHNPVNELIEQGGYQFLEDFLV